MDKMFSTGLNVVGFNWPSFPAKNSGYQENSSSGLERWCHVKHEAILATLVATKNKMLNQIGRNNIGKLLVYGSYCRKDLRNRLVPCYVTVGTTFTMAINPVGVLCHVAKDYEMLIYVDAAYAGSAYACSVEDANSFSLNTHKWFLTNLDYCCL
ncbi:hypothetical protein HN51_052577 [Arachis hypogaea]